MESVAGRQIVRGFRRLRKRTGMDVLIGDHAEPVAVIVEPVTTEQLPESVSTRGTGTWVRVMLVRSDLPDGDEPEKGTAMRGGGKRFRVVAIEGEPTDPIGAYICSMSTDTSIES